MNLSDEKLKEWLTKVIDTEVESQLSDIYSHHLSIEDELYTFISRGDLILLSILAHRYIEDYDYENDDSISWYHDKLERLVDKEIGECDNWMTSEYSDTVEGGMNNESD